MSKRKGLEAKLAQMFVVGVDGTELSKPSADFLTDYQLGGVISSPNNYKPPPLLAEMSDSMQDPRDKAVNLPLFIGAAHKGGRVQRLKNPFPHFPKPAVLGEIN